MLDGSTARSVRAQRFELGALTVVVADYAARLDQPRHCHDEPSCAFLVRGSLEESAAAGSHRAVAGDEVVKPAGVDHADRFGADGARMVAIRWERTADAAAPPVRYTWRRGLLRLGRAVALVRDARRGSDDALALEERALELFAGAGDPPAETARRIPAPPWIRGACARLADDPTLPSVRELARSAGVHPVHLARTFRAATGITLRAWRRRLRIARAIDLMHARRASLARVALEAGFADHAHFSRSFRRELGITPSEYDSVAGRSGAAAACGRRVASYNAAPF